MENMQRAALAVLSILSSLAVASDARAAIVDYGVYKVEASITGDDTHPWRTIKDTKAPGLWSTSASAHVSDLIGPVDASWSINPLTSEEAQVNIDASYEVAASAGYGQSYAVNSGEIHINYHSDVSFTMKYYWDLTWDIYPSGYMEFNFFAQPVKLRIYDSDGGWRDPTWIPQSPPRWSSYSGNFAGSMTIDVGPGDWLFIVFTGGSKSRWGGEWESVTGNVYLDFDGGERQTSAPRDLTFASGMSWNANNAWLDGSTPATWSNNGPDNALFTGHSGTGIQVSAPVSVGSMRFEGPGELINGEQITISGGIVANAPVGFSNPISISRDQTWAVAQSQDIILNGALAGTGNLTKTGPGTLSLHGDTSGLDGGIVLSEGTLHADALRLDSLVIGTGQAKITSNSVSRLERLQFTEAQLDQPVPIVSAGQFDLGTAALILSPGAGETQQVYHEIVKLIRCGRDSSPSRWMGNGLTSSAAASNADTGLIAMINDRGDGQPLVPLLGGLAVGMNDIILKYSWNGDLNLDGRINADDYFYIDQGYLQKPPAPTYHDGDFNYDGKVNADDYFMIDQAFLNQKGVLLGSDLTPVPEPGGLTLLCATAAALMMRRR